jgi:hypothetical protein
LVQWTNFNFFYQARSTINSNLGAKKDIKESTDSNNVTIEDNEEVKIDKIGKLNARFFSYLFIYLDWYDFLEGKNSGGWFAQMLICPAYAVPLHLSTFVLLRRYYGGVINAIINAIKKKPRVFLVSVVKQIEKILKS